ncbi:MAG: 3-phosphoshikimate 1-carboxyvinyltransferase [Deltaproteobacteria bacterium]|nr:3-phosphoshikimate 1-carboxyvinyltransferase [Deltaproteobacteria bacterium]MBW2084575.1 3-phosphoshikimate 1-carboxyvinyltransferase [Deltaproteobacteria bacterium]
MEIINDSSQALAEIEIPGSKSLTHRALIIAALAEGKSRISQPLLCEDTRLTIEALRRLGAEINPENGDLVVTGTGGRLAESGPEINLKNSGTSMRLLASVTALSPGTWILTGNERMQTRPIEPLLTALSDLGAKATALRGTGCPPVKILGGGLKGGKTRISAAKSSQYLSSLLLSSPYAQEDVIIEVTDQVASWPYVELTLAMMEAFGVKVERQDRRWFRIQAGQRYQAQDVTIEGDCSSAAYFWAAAAATGSYVITHHIKPFSLQPDFRFLDVLTLMGCEVMLGRKWVAVRGGALSGIEVDMNAMPDQVPTLAILAALAKGQTSIRNVAHLHYKESDRLVDLGAELQKLGVCVEVKDDGLKIKGGSINRGIVDPHHDHRLAMSFAVARLVRPEIKILDPDCVVKSFPDFWGLFARLSS